MRETSALSALYRRHFHPIGARSGSWLLAICLSLITGLAWSQATEPVNASRFPSRLDLMRGESELSQAQRSLPIPPVRKPTGEMFGSFDITQMTFYLDASSGFPTDVRTEFEVRAAQDQLANVLIFFFNVGSNELRMSITYEGRDAQPLSFTELFDGRLSLNLPIPLNLDERARVSVQFSRVDWEAEGPPSVVDDGLYAHLVTSQFLPYNGEVFIYDFVEVNTVINTTGRDYPAGLGSLEARPMDGQPGEWRYRSESPAPFYVYAVGGEYPLSVDGRVEIFHSSSFGISEASEEIIQASLDAVRVYEELYGPFPYSRLGIAPISDFAGAAIGPQAQILLPDFFWFPGLEFDATFGRTAVTYHEIGHQYFFNLVQLRPEPELGQAWLSEALAEFSALRALDEVQGDSELYRAVNFLYYEELTPQPHMPVASVEVQGSENYFTIVYLLGSTLVYGLYHRMEDFTEVFRECMNVWRGQMIGVDDMFGCFRQMTPREAYRGFVVDEYIDRYFTDTTFDVIEVAATYLDDERSALEINSEAWSDVIEVVELAPNGAESALYTPRGVGQVLEHVGAAARVDPIRTTPRRVLNVNPVDVDLNGVVDGQDALDVLYSRGRGALDNQRIFYRWADVDQDGVISDSDLTDVVRAMGSYRR